MLKHLVIVESPAKAKTINRYLGPDYIVEASVGHVKDLPREELAIDIEGGFVPTYEVIRGKREIVDRLRGLAGRCKDVFIATDPDREGEAIANHIADEIRASNGNIRRVLFNEITKSGVTAAMQRPRDIDAGMVQAQEARRVMDRLIGYKVSPFLWRRFSGEARGLSAGRVQTVALRLVAERERAINSFLPVEYWNLIATFATREGREIRARLVRADGKDIRNPSGSAADGQNPDGTAKPRQPGWYIDNEKQAAELRERALAEQYAISSIARKEVRKNAPQPFTTSTLQQEASKKLRMNPGRTMKLAQQLYEGVELGPRGRMGLITYMRTDSVRVSEEAVTAAHEFIYLNFGNDYVPPRAATTAPARKAAKGPVQDAHEAIRPADPALHPKDVRKHADRELADLYELIWSRFIASQMSAALLDQTTVEITGGPFVFRATGRITRFSGWMQVYTEVEEDAGEKQKGKGRAAANAAGDDAEELMTTLPDTIAEGDPLTIQGIESKRSATKPPIRYTESLLVKELEARGIGRPSTYAAIIATIQDRGYVEQRERRLYCTELGMKVCDMLVAGFPALFDVKFTARMEGELDTIAGGRAAYRAVMEGFYKPLEAALRTAARAARQVGPGAGAASGALNESGERGLARRDAQREPATRGGAGRAVEARPSATKCPTCSSPMELRKGRYGHYLACLGFPKCRTTIPVAADGSPRAPKQAAVAADAGVVCDACGAPMVRRKARGGNEFYGCSGYPACSATKPIPLGVTCPQCKQGAMVERMGGRYRSVFYACTRYPECRFTSSRKPTNVPCPACHNEWSVVAWRQGEGEFQECPKCRHEFQPPKQATEATP